MCRCTSASGNDGMNDGMSHGKCFMDLKSGNDEMIGSGYRMVVRYARI